MWVPIAFSLKLTKLDKVWLVLKIPFLISPKNLACWEIISEVDCLVISALYLPDLTTAPAIASVLISAVFCNVLIVAKVSEDGPAEEDESPPSSSKLKSSKPISSSKLSSISLPSLAAS